MAAHLGYIRAGLPGLLAGGIGFILPGAVMSLVLGILYAKYGSIPQVEGVFQGINPVVSAILTSAFIRLGKSAFHDYKTIFIGAASLIAALFGIEEIPIIFRQWTAIHPAVFPPHNEFPAPFYGIWHHLPAKGCHNQPGKEPANPIGPVFPESRRTAVRQHLRADRISYSAMWSINTTGSATSRCWTR